MEVPFGANVSQAQDHRGPDRSGLRGMGRLL